MTNGELLMLLAFSVNAVVFTDALLTYLRRRQVIPLHVAFMFVAPTLAFVVNVCQLLHWLAPGAGANLVAAVYLSRGFVTLLLAARLRPVSRWITSGYLLACMALVWPVLTAPRPFPPHLSLLFALVYASGEVAAALIFQSGANRRTGTAATRIRIAAFATWLQVAIVILPAIGGLTNTAADDGNNGLTASAVFGAFVAYSYSWLILISTTGYLVAFLPPSWLRRVWSARTLHAASEHILRASPTEAAWHVWRRYTDTVAEVASAEAVAVLVRQPDGSIEQMANTGMPAEPPHGYRGADLYSLHPRREQLIAGSLGEPPPLLGHYLAQWPGLAITAVSFPDDRDGMLLIGNRYPTLFREDDFQLLADLSAPAAVLSERSMVLARQMALNAELEASLSRQETGLVQQRQLADQLSTSVQVLTAAAQAKDTFLATMSHELRTPLHAIIGFADLMRTEPESDGHRTVPSEWVDHVAAGSNHLLSRINDMLDLAKIDAGRLDLHRMPTPLAHTVDDLVRSLRPLLDRQRLNYHADIPSITIDVDPMRLRQILENLLSNAIKFTPAGGDITITGQVNGRDLTITVTDTGVGIAPEYQGRIFTDFEQAGDVNQRAIGTGLGLGLARRLTTAHGGDLSFVSTEGAGSSFIVNLPGVALHAPATTGRAAH